MKKISEILICLAVCTISCQKAQDVQQYHESTALLVESNAKSSFYSISVSLGHLASECKGRCVYSDGQWYHFDCMGFGNACSARADVNLVENSNNNYSATTTDSLALTNEELFNMPSRSLFVGYDDKNNEVWLNIPEQLVYRDSVSKQFTFTNLYYSNARVYAND